MNICFLNYISRSGSTLLSSYLDANPEVFVTIEADLPKEIIKGKTHSEEELLRILRKISKGNKFRKNWDISIDEMYNAIDLPVDNFEIWKQILLLYYKKKVPDQERRAKIITFKGFRPSIFEFSEMISAYPDYKMLYLYRDPRAVFNSQSKTYSTSDSKIYNTFFSLPFTSSPYEVADEWKTDIKEMKRLNKTENFKSVSYEDFVRYPQKVLDEIFDYLDVAKIDYPDRDLTDYKSKIPADQRALHKFIGEELKESRIRAWKKELDINSIKVIENICRNEMRDCGYEFYAKNKPAVSIYFQLKVKLKQIILNYRYKLKRIFTSFLRKTGISQRM